ncbi:ankyrin repeat domain-containing protein [bacterium]|nr:ankyrin repeat domain-containing protein [bacterium]
MKIKNILSRLLLVATMLTAVPSQAGIFSKTKAFLTNHKSTLAGSALSMSAGVALAKILPKYTKNVSSKLNLTDSILKKIIQKHPKAYGTLFLGAITACYFLENRNQILRKAAIKGNYRKAWLSLKLGANVNDKFNYTMTPLHRAAQNGYTEMAKLFLAHGAKINAKNFGEETALSLAISAGHTETAKLLIANSANINTTDTLDKVTPLHNAIICNHKDIIKLLIAHGANIIAKTQSNLTPRDYAAQFSANAKIETRFKDLEQLLTDLSKQANKQEKALFLQAIRNDSKLNQDTVELFIQNQLMRKTITPKLVYSALKKDSLRLFHSGALSSEWLKQAISTLSPTIDELSFIWDKNWKNAKATPLSKGLQALYHHSKKMAYKAYGKTINDYGITLKRLSKGGTKLKTKSIKTTSKQFGMGIAHIIASY